MTGKHVEGIDEVKAMLMPWLSERLADAALLKQPLVVMLHRVLAEGAERLIFSDRLEPADDIESWVDELVEHAFDACESRSGRHRFVVRLKDDSRCRRFTLHAGTIEEERASTPAVAPESALSSARRLTDRLIGPPADPIIERVFWALWAAAAITNTAAFTKPTTEEKPKTPTGTGGKPTVASRQYGAVAADTVASYAARVANETLASYREKWKKGR